MLLRKSVLLISFQLVFLGLVWGQQEALNKIDKKDLKNYLTFISSDELQGRKLGTEVDGLGITADYLAKHAERIGLEPGAVDYFQPVPMISTKPNAQNFIEVLDGKGKPVLHSGDVLIMKGVREGFEVENEKIVLAGFGEELTQKQVEGKILLIGQGNKESFKAGDFAYRYRDELSKIEALAALNPKAILAVSGLKDEEQKAFKGLRRYLGRERFSVSSGEGSDKIPVMLVNPAVADGLCGGEGKYLDYLQQEANRNTPKVKTIKKKRLTINAGTRRQNLNAKNVIGIVEGSDPVLKDEYVVFMAHYDHVGVAKGGEVYNGADDNGSGTVAILEVAEAFASLKVKPKRSIVFLWVTCEEIGHIGSTYYCDNPIYPLEKTVLSINLDMVGRVYDGPRDDVWKDSPKKVKDFKGLYTLSNDVWPELAAINDAKCRELGIEPDTSLPKSRFLRASDHYHFHKNGVPILNYATGYHADYHKVGDEVDKINFDKIKLVADLCFLLGYEVANRDNIEISHPNP